MVHSSQKTPARSTRSLAPAKPARNPQGSPSLPQSNEVRCGGVGERRTKSESVGGGTRSHQTNRPGTPQVSRNRPHVPPAVWRQPNLQGTEGSTPHGACQSLRACRSPTPPWAPPRGNETINQPEAMVHSSQKTPARSTRSLAPANTARNPQGSLSLPLIERSEVRGSRRARTKSESVGGGTRSHQRTDSQRSNPLDRGR